MDFFIFIIELLANYPYNYQDISNWVYEVDGCRAHFAKFIMNHLYTTVKII